MLSEIFFSSSSCSLVLVISLLASPTFPIPPSGLFPPIPPPPPPPPAFCLSFWACIISCLFFSASSSLFLFSSASFAFFSASSFLNLSSSSFFCCASFFSCSALISFLLACFSFSLLSSSSSLALCFLHSLIYSLSCSSNSPFLASPRALRKFPSPFLEVLDTDSSSQNSSSDIVILGGVQGVEW